MFGFLGRFVSDRESSEGSDLEGTRTHARAHTKSLLRDIITIILTCFQCSRRVPMFL
jgi:hypothetical protein